MLLVQFGINGIVVSFGPFVKLDSPGGEFGSISKHHKYNYSQHRMITYTKAWFIRRAMSAPN